MEESDTRLTRVRSAVSTYLEEFRDPTKLEYERAVPFSEILQYSLSLIGRHVLVGFRVIRKAVDLLDQVDALVAKVTDDEHVRRKHQANECDPKKGICQACQHGGDNGLEDKEDGDVSHQCRLLDQNHRCLGADVHFDDLKGM